MGLQYIFYYFFTMFRGWRGLGSKPDPLGQSAIFLNSCRVRKAEKGQGINPESLVQNARVLQVTPGSPPPRFVLRKRGEGEGSGTIARVDLKSR